MHYSSRRPCADMLSLTCRDNLPISARKLVSLIDLGWSDNRIAYYFGVEPVKVSALCTKELLGAMSAEGLNTLGRELRAGVASGSDGEFLSALSGNSSEAQGLDSFQGFVDDVEEMARLLELGVASRPFLILAPEVAKAAALQAQTAGVTSLLWNGGSIAGIPILVSEAQSPDRATMVDASAIAIALEEINLRSSRVASVELDTAPSGSAVTGSGTSQVSLFQTNSVALLAERSFAVKALRGTAFHHLTNVALGETSASPAVA